MTTFLHNVLRNQPKAYRAFISLAMAVLVVLFLPGCASMGGASFEDEIDRWRAESVQRPNAAEPYREIGILYLGQNDLIRANQNMEQAYARDTNDPKTLYYLGLINEKLGRKQTAVRLFEQYSNAPSNSMYRSMMEGRYQWLVREIATDEIREMLAQEENLGPGNASPNVVAVFPFTYQGGNEQYAPIGRGLAEMTMVDLSKVRGLIVVERVRLQALLGELRLGQSEYVDPATAPRVGRLLEAGRLIGGAYAVSNDEQIRVDATLWETQATAAPEFEAQTGALRNFFQFQKVLVFQLIDEMGIQLSPEDRQEIERVPTQNLQAFLAYSRGLERQDAGAYAEAAQLFRQAAQADPSFEEATTEAEQTERTADVAGDTDLAINTGIQRESATEVTENPDAAGGGTNMDLLGNRIRTLNGSLGTAIVPNVESRNPDSEIGADPEVIPPIMEGLPDPPPPPPSN